MEWYKRDHSCAILLPRRESLRRVIFRAEVSTHE